MKTHRITLVAADGHRFAAFVADPEDASTRGAVVVIPEIFGVNGHIRAVAEGYATAGYLTLAPQFFDRAVRDYERGYGADDIAEGRAIIPRLDWRDTLRDLDAAVAHVAPAGKVGVVGFCWGGTGAWRAAARTDGIACAVAYYGGGIHGAIDETPRVPVLLHFGETDTSPTLEQAREIVARHPQAEAHFYSAGHGFNCDQRASYDAASARLANGRSLAFLQRHVG